MFVTRIQAGGIDRSPYGSFFFEPVGRMAASGARVTPSSSLGLPAVWACVRVLAESFAVLPFQLLQQRVGGGRNRVQDHWLWRLFTKAPNRFQSPFEWREMLQGHLALRGNAFCQITPDGGGGIAELLPLNPDRMKMELLPNGSNRYVYTAQGGATIYFARGEIWHLRGLSSDGHMGMSPIEVAREAVGEGLAMQDYAARYFANDSKPGGGWIEFAGKFADKAAKTTFRESWQELQGGANRGKVAVLENGMKFHELGITNKDSQFIEARAAKVSDIARIFRIPPHKIGDLSKATFSNIEQQSIEFWQDTMLPWTERWESSIESFLLGPDTDLDVEFDMRRMMRGDAAARGVYYNTGIFAGWLMRNEAREEEGLDPIDGLDEPLVPMNMSVVGDQPIDPAAGNNAEPALDDSGAARLDGMITATAERLTRRAMGALEKKPAAEVFDEAFSALVASSLLIEQAAAQSLCLSAIVEQGSSPTSFEAYFRGALISLARDSR